VHKADPDPELVEEGQLLTMTVPNWDRVYGTGGHGDGHGDNEQNGHGRND
jgi:hypothetical protein